MKKIGTILKNRRKQEQLTLSQVAKKLRVSVQFVSNIEHNRAPVPATYVTKLADTLGISPGWLALTVLKQSHVFKSYAKIASKYYDVSFNQR